MDEDNSRVMDLDHYPAKANGNSVEGYAIAITIFNREAVVLCKDVESCCVIFRKLSGKAADRKKIIPVNLFHQTNVSRVMPNF